jgi:O-antigen/teichoic acid export membrane protein
LLQITAYVGFLDLGIQTAVSRFVAHADELNDPARRNGIASTAAVLLAVVSGMGLCVVGLLAWQLPHIFTAMPTNVQGQAEIALLLMGSSLALGLPFSVVHAVFVGLQRSEIPAGITIANRFGVTAATVALAMRHSGIATMGAGVALANVLSCGASYFAWRAWAPNVALRISLASRAYAQEIAGYSIALLAWFAATLMISGLDLSLVAFFDYQATAYYAVAVTLTNFIVQTQSTIFAALLPAFAVLNARSDAQKLGTVLISSTRYGMLVLLGMALPLVLAGKVILRVWVGANYASHSVLIMQVLVVANVVRLSALPYSTLLLGTGEQRKVILSPLAEGVTNLVASVFGAYLLGAIGVAIGTFIGSFVGVGLNLFYNMPRTSAISVDRSALMKEGLVRPMVCAFPLVFALFCYVVTPITVHTSNRAMVLYWGVAIVTTCLVFWNYGLHGSERRKLLNGILGAS